MFQPILNVKQVDLKHIDQEKGSNVVDVGIDLKEYYLSAEWDLLSVPATRYTFVNLAWGLN